MLLRHDVTPVWQHCTAVVSEKKQHQHWATQELLLLLLSVRKHSHQTLSMLSNRAIPSLASSREMISQCREFK
jgi:hypothetical protein